jgi:diacylglycerol kinase family enzyme
VLIVANPRAGVRSGKPLVERLAWLLAQANLAAEIVHERERLVELAAEAAVAGNLRAIVAAGGDGTVAFVANSVPEAVPIVMLPLGTENLLAKYVGLTADPEQVVQTILQGKVATLDAGRANGRLFLLMISCGFDAEVVHRLHRERRGHIHHLSYIKPILDAVRSYQYPELRIYCDEAADRDAATSPALRARWAFVVNLPRYAIGLQIAPEASGSDGLLDLCTFEHGSLISGLRYFGGVYMGWHRGWSDFRQRRVKRLRIESDEPAPYQLDGDPGGMLPVEIEVLPNRLALLVPPQFVTQTQAASA